MLRKLLTVLVIAPVAIVLLVFTVANRHAVLVSFDPINPQDPVYGLELEMPLFLLVFISLLTGVVAGGIATWFGQGSWRRAARQNRAEVARAERESTALRRAVAKSTGPALPVPEKTA